MASALPPDPCSDAYYSTAPRNLMGREASTVLPLSRLEAVIIEMETPHFEKIRLDVTFLSSLH